MPDGGERGEGHENSGQDPFARYAEELGKKYGESKGADEHVQHNPNPDAAPRRQAAESPVMEEDDEKDEFEVYAKQLREKYVEEEGSMDSPQVGQCSSGADNKITSRERQASVGPNEEAPDDQKQESANLNPQQATDSTAGDATPKSGDRGCNKLESMEEPKDLIDQPDAPIDPNSQKDSEHAKTHPKETGLASPSLGTDSEIQLEKAIREPRQASPISQETDSSRRDSTEPFSIPVTVNSTHRLPGAGVDTTRLEGQGVKENPRKERAHVNVPGIEATTTEAKDVPSEHPNHSTRETHSSIIEAPVYRLKDGLLVTTVRRSSFLKATGKEFEVGKEYEINGRVVGISGFETSHIEREESKSRRQISLVVGKYEGHLISGQRCKIAIDSVTERERFRVSSGEGRIIEMWQPAMNSVGFPEAGRFSKDNVVQFRAGKASESREASKRCFVTIRPDQQSIQMRVGRLGFKPRDIVKISHSQSYDIRDFVKDFNTHQRVGLENTQLKSHHGVLTMLVDDRRIELRNPRLYTVALRVTLWAEIGDSKRPVRFWFDGERTKPRIDLFRIYKIRSSEAGLTISYMKDRSQRRSFYYSFDKFGPKHLHGVKLISAPETKNDSFHYRVSAKFQADVIARLAESSDNRRLMKGTISERIQRHILSSMPDWIEVEDHPFDKVRKADDSLKNGPDGLWRLKTTGELHYLEFKWRQGSKDTYYQGQNEVRRYLAKHPAYKGERVSGGYVGFIEWNTKSQDLFFYLRKVEPARTRPRLEGHS